MLRQISSHVYCWSEIHGAARNEPYPWNSYLIDVPNEDAAVLVDPLRMSLSDAREIEKIGIPTHILLTCEFHLRESEIFRERWGCEIWVNEIERDRYETSLDRTFVHGQRLWDFIDPIYVPDVYFPETVLLVRESGGGLIIGDMLSGGRQDAGIAEGDLGIYAPDYIAELEKARNSIALLLNNSYSFICFGHGTPIFDEPKAKLRRYVESDEIWENLARRKRVSV
jgi:glyoxylase-like metal-dependent hydrolase (beta-lactamase superfamily II)